VPSLRRVAVVLAAALVAAPAPGAQAQAGAQEVVVAVVDTGVDLDHPDLRDALWRNPREVPGNGVDDDRDGFVDDVHGADIAGRDGDPRDDQSHGTRVAGLIAARGAVPGVAPGAKLMAVKVLDARGRGGADDVARGVRYAVRHGARIINLSLTTPARYAPLRRAIGAAQRAGVLVVAAAGNTGRRPEYPVAYGAPNVVGVAAIEPDGTLLPTSARGRRVELAALGRDVLSTVPGGGHATGTGTSMAAPLVAGRAALAAARRPRARWPELRAVLRGVARPAAIPTRWGMLGIADWLLSRR